MTVISGPMNDRPWQPYGNLVRPSAGSPVGYAVAGGRYRPTNGLAPCSEPGSTLETGKETRSEAVHVQRRGKSIRLACGCGNFVLSFHDLSVVRHGRFRCPICGREAQLVRLEALLEICRASRAGEVRAFMAEIGLFDPE